MIKTKIKISTLLFMLALFWSVSANASEKLPAFSWDKVPVCIHLANVKDDFSERDLKFMARFPIVCIEKAQSVAKYGYMEKGTEIASKGIKKYNPDSKILFYWNSRIDYGELYSQGKILDKHPDWMMVDAKGNPSVVQKRKRLTYDPTVKAFRDWWVSIPVAELDRNENLDGVFVDAVLQYVSVPAMNSFGQEKSESVKAGLYSMLTSLKESLDDDKIILANSLRGVARSFPDMGRSFNDYIDGAMMEHFASLSGSDKDVIVNDIALIQEASKLGKVVVVKGWPTFNFTDPTLLKTNTQRQLEQRAADDITFPLACFLVAAGERSYFCYSWGYRNTDGGLVDYSEYNRPLGEPKGDAVKNGYIYTREFKNCSVWVDVSNRNATINWTK